MEKNQIYLEFSEEIQAVLADNGLSIQQILQQESIQAKVTQGESLFQGEDGSRSKELVTIVTIIAAIGFSAIPVGVAISKVLKTIYGRPHKIEYYENEELRDGKGNVMMDEQGKPIYNPKIRHEILEPQNQNDQLSFEGSYNKEKGVTFKFSSQEGTPQISKTRKKTPKSKTELET